MLKDLKELLVVLVTFALQQTTKKKFKTNKQTNKQKTQLDDTKFVVKQYINRFKLIMTPTCEKNLLPLSQKWNDNSYLQENQGL